MAVKGKYAVPAQSRSLRVSGDCPACMSCRPSLKTLLDIIWRPYDGIDYVVVHDIHETMLDAGVVSQQRPREPIVPQVPEFSVQGGAM